MFYSPFGRQYQKEGRAPSVTAVGCAALFAFGAQMDPTLVWDGESLVWDGDSLVWDAVVLGIVTPAERMLIVQADDRVLIVQPDDRTVTVQ